METPELKELLEAFEGLSPSQRARLKRAILGPEPRKCSYKHDVVQVTHVVTCELCGAKQEIRYECFALAKGEAPKPRSVTERVPHCSECKKRLPEQIGYEAAFEAVLATYQKAS